MTIADIPNYTKDECDAFTEALKLDPIIVAMYDEVFDHDKKILAEGGFSESQEFVLALVSAQEYEDRGGTLESHLGGPFDAVVSLCRDALATS